MKSRAAAELDVVYMRQAIRLAARATGRTRPNPLVGALVVKNGRVVGRGYHHQAGQPHAEVFALDQAGPLARGATLYVNLEPCCHWGRTGPCVEKIIAARIRRVVIGMLDPNPKINGGGIKALRQRGIKVDVGVLENECKQLNAPFLCYLANQRPLVTWKSAITLDGRVATKTGDSRWVSGEESRLEGHRLRNTHDAIMVGVGTVLADNPRLTCRGRASWRDPIRIVVDSKLRTPVDAATVQAQAQGSTSPTWIFTTTSASANKERRLIEAGAQVFRVAAAKNGLVDVSALLTSLAQKEILSVLLEGGPTLAGAFWQARLIDRLVFFVATKILADPQAKPMIIGAPAKAMAEATLLTNVSHRLCGKDLLISGEPQYKE